MQAGSTQYNHKSMDGKDFTAKALVFKPSGKTSGPICIGENKRRLMLELAGKKSIDLKNAYAYGNHESGVPQLEAVGNPCAVEPTPKIRQIALKRDWPILTFR